MFLTEKKDINEVVKALDKYKKIGIIGCASCASICLTGGSMQVKEMQKYLSGINKEITFTISIDEPCDLRVLKEDIRFVEDELKDTEAIVVLSCGTGVQTIGGFTGKKIVAGANSKFIAQTEHIGEYNSLCQGCDECRLNFTGGVCTITLCPKGLLNGPCEGHDGIKCEVDEESQCVFMSSYVNISRFSEEENINKIFPPRDYSVKRHIKRIVI
jgi:ferredoxin